MAESCSKIDLEDCFDTLAQEARELYLDRSVPVLEKTPTPLQFYRDYVAPNKPVILSNFTASWAALHKWNLQYLREAIGSEEVTVAVTPNGYADAVYQGQFVMPEERLMRVHHFLDILENPDSAEGVFYVQKQNSNLTEEFQSVMGDVETEPSWGTEVFGKPPDAVNMWIGDGRAITSKIYPSAHYKEEKGQFSVVPDPDTGEVPWIAVDPLKPDLSRYPDYSRCRPLQVTVQAGQTLYLPSLWFHHVRQSHGCIAVNLWYDMEFDIKYNYYKFVEKVADLVRKK